MSESPVSGDSQVPLCFVTIPERLEEARYLSELPGMVEGSPAIIPVHGPEDLADFLESCRSGTGMYGCRIWPLGPGGDGRWQGALEFLGLPWIGSRVSACTLASRSEWRDALWPDVMARAFGEVDGPPRREGPLPPENPLDHLVPGVIRISLALAGSPDLDDGFLSGVPVFPEGTEEATLPENLAWTARLLARAAVTETGVEGWALVTLEHSGKEWVLMDVDTDPEALSGSALVRSFLGAGFSVGDMAVRVLYAASAREKRETTLVRHWRDGI